MSWKKLKSLRWRARSGGPLKLFCAGSGLARVPKGFWSVADDLNHLVFIPDGKAHGLGRRIFSGEPPLETARRKRVKRDLESLIDLGGGKLVAFPSGSKNRRCRGSLITLTRRGAFKRAKEINFRTLMELLGDKIPDLNIEGGFVRGKRLVLLQRGNGKAGVNAVVKLNLGAFLKGRWRAAALELKITRVALGRWGKTPLTFTDGFLHAGTAYFSAAAEAGQDTYRDGKILGSVVGLLPRGGKPVILARLPGEKIEGLALASEKNGARTAYAVTDADNPRKASRLFRLALDD